MTDPSIDTILQAALDIPDPQARTAYLDEVCGDKAGLRAEIDSLLGAHLAADTFMNTRCDSLWDEVLSGTDAGFMPTPEELTADFPELEIVELIGRGGMGAVFKARQASLDRFVALKVLPGEWNTTGNFPERFEREAKILAGLNHPGIVTIHEFGERNGRFFFTMEFVDGTDLGRMIHGGEMPPELALKLIPQICDAMQFAHDRGVVHRDIKPGNILVDREGRVKVADFGIAKLGTTREEGPDADAANAPTADLTTPHGIVGTPRYMAPEQATASTTVDHRADLYALGVVFYEMLVGTPPDKDALSLPPSRQLKVDRRWDEVVKRALAEDPDRRYQNASEIRTAVESVLSEQKSSLPNWLKAVAVLTALIAVISLWPKADSEPDGPLVNSLEMQFVPVEGVAGLVSTWETRVKDYEAFVNETKRGWLFPLFEQTPNHPAVNVSWYDAQAFCEWLTEREHQAGLLPPGEVYRLPTDREWSAMARLTGEEGGDPKERHLGQQTIYPWGEEGPVPAGAGNFPDATGRSQRGTASVPDYDDGFGATAPVGSFPATGSGLHDLGGNVWEWTSSLHTPDDARPVLRGGGWWASEADDGWKSLLASYRRADVEATKTEGWDVGFRVVRGPAPIDSDSQNLFRLAQNGDLDGVAQAIAAGADLNESNRAGQPPIVLAADAGKFEMVKLIGHHGASLHKSDRRGRTALHAAAELGHTEMVRWLLAEGANARVRTIARQEPFLLAVPRAPVELLELLLASAGPECLTRVDTNGVSALTAACIGARVETVGWVIENLSDEQIRDAGAENISLWLTTLVKQESSLLGAFLAKASDHLKPEMTLTPLMSTIQFDKEEHFDLLMEAVSEDALDRKAAPVLGKTAAMLGRPWAIKRFISMGWDLKGLKLEDDRNLLHAAVMNTASLKNELKPIAKKLGVSLNDQWSRNFLDRELAQIPAQATGETIRVLCKAGADIEARDKDGKTPLISAALSRNLAAVDALLDLGADFTAKDNEGFTPLLCAVEKGALGIVKALEGKGADFKTANKQGRGALHVCASDEEVYRYVLDKGLPLELQDDDGATPLILRANEADEGVISLLLEAGADVRATTGSKGLMGTTALHAACRMLDAEAEQDIRERAEALGGKKSNPRTPVSREERIRSIKLLVDRDAELRGQEGGSTRPLHLAKESDWMTPLHLAARYGLHEALELFLDEYDAPDVLTLQLNHPLHLAAEAGHLECVKVLVEHGATLHNASWFSSVVTAAVKGGNPELVAYLVENKAPIDRRDVRGSGAYPIHLAAEGGNVRILEALLSGQDEQEANKRDNFGATPMHRAAMHNQREAIDFLLQRDARANVADRYGLSPAEYAARQGHHALATHLRDLADKQRIKRQGRKLPPKNQNQ